MGDTCPMGLKDLFRKWSKGEDQRVIERAEAAAHMTPVERYVASEDFESRKDDLNALNTRTGSEAAEAAGDDLDTLRR